ncbi:MAG: hypothetical protein PHF37_05365 [Phycisphaerae bacterium]|nr:hypothetical protein [Phycisphaerae bacterium]
MVALVKAIGVVITAMGVVYLIYPQVIRAIINFFSVGYRIYLAAVVRLVFGVILLLAASKAAHPKLVTVLGILFLLGAILIVALGPKRISPMLTWYKGWSLFAMRVVAILITLFGLLVIYAA